MVYNCGVKEVHQMRMSVTLDELLLEEAHRLSGKKTRREVLDEALREFIRKKKRDKALQHAGKIKINLTLKKLQEIRESK
jgi:metal-responsive CopG/Arc/MetJ family transcriptional regulator